MRKSYVYRFHFIVWYQGMYRYQALTKSLYGCLQALNNDALFPVAHAAAVSLKGLGDVKRSS